MLSKKLRCFATMMSLVMSISLFAGCSKEKNDVDTSKNNSEVKADSGTIYPLEGEHKITYWTQGFVHPDYPTQKETPLMQEMMKRTGVDVDFIHQTSPEAFSLMVASGDLPDVFKFDLIKGFPGGPSAAIQQGVAIELNEYLEKYAPNLMKFYAENPDIEKLVKTDDGSFYNFPFVRGSDYLTTFVGPMLRKDWLDKLGLAVPETIDEWYTVLQGFKTMGAKSPLTSEILIVKDANPFVGAYNTSFGMHLQDGKIVYGPIQDGYKDFLKTFAKWYAEGLIDPDIATVDKNQVDAKMTTGESGAAVGHTGSRMGAWLSAMKDDASYDIVAAKYPVLKKGDKPQFGQSQAPYFGMGVGISSKCKDIEAAVKFLDYGYSEEGHMLYNFGIEGESYEMVDGYPTYTDLIMKNPDGVPIAQMLLAYVQSSYNGPLIQDQRYMEQYSEYQQQKDAIEIWKDTDIAKHMLPPVTLNQDESSEVASIKSEIEAYVDEFFYKSMFGDVNIDAEWDKYVDTVNKMGVTDMIKTYEEALVRYNNR
ncbi:extracellular solute-binding protein [Clostridium grantii]|uniref:Putative aldouronate transport system substrate-binding protein n=1 Tax=Clostridium grantii DSM 8605 TaxID=1121316 RepID=A0A1M5XRT7_9CLOT|nr:extracellular solute-binding protein [Clostridium grantii]SHI02531.1 putative aldouronate transport system substrate-binding protein [Clostridium grantii DSM 8605]